jgi:hypothetical protein
MATRPPRVIWAFLALVTSSCVSSASPTPEQGADAAWPSEGLARFVFERVEVSSFRNSTGPMREAGFRTFADYGIALEAATEDRAVSGESCEPSDAEDCWLREIRVLGKRDFNGDGITDVAICFTDQSRDGGTYFTVRPLLLQLIAGRVVAVGYEIADVDEAADCQPIGGDI